MSQLEFEPELTGRDPPVADQPVALSLPVATFGTAVLAVGLSSVVGQSGVQLFLLVVGIVLLSFAIVFAGRMLRQAWRSRVMHATLLGVISGSPDVNYVTDAGGTILQRNQAATDNEDRRNISTLSAAMGSMFANPDVTIARMFRSAEVHGRAQEDIVSRRGHLRLSVQQISEHTFVWSLYPLAERMGLERATNAISLPMMTVSPGGTILFMNDAMREMTGGRARALSDVFLDPPLVSGAVHKVDGRQGVVQALVAQVHSSGGRTEIYLLPDDTEEAPVARVSGWSEVEDLPVPLLKLTVDGEVLAATRQARTLLPREIAPGTRLSDLLEGLGRPIIDWLSDAASGREMTGAEFLRCSGPGRETFVQVSLNLAGDGKDERYLVAVLNDATELKSLEAQFVQSQKMQAIGQLAGGVAHDFNNLLTAISGHCDLLLLRHDQGDQDYGDLIQIHQNANRAASLVGQLLAFSRKQNLMPEVIDLRDTLAELTHLLNRLVGEKVTLTLDHDPLLKHIRADKRQLEQVLMNLVVNARDAMPDGGEIRVLTENIELKTALERDRAKVPPGQYSVLRVIDEGAGIPPEKLPKIFEPFWTTKRPGEGTGLGLSTAYGIVKQTGGFIFADSTEGEGSTFSLYFPSHEPPLGDVVDAPARVSALPLGQTDGVILLVEDEAPVRAFASRALRMRGYSVLEAESAEAALDLLEDKDLSVDIFVTDVIMPGKDGPTWVREALRDRPETKVVFVSGYAEDTFSEHQAEIPNSVFLPKPFSLTDLTQTVQRQLVQ